MKDNRKYVSYDTRFRTLGLDVLNMILLTEIENLSKLPKGCYASDKQLSELITINEKNTRERLYFMRDLGHIGIQTKF
jgi:transcription initiation factor IIE alpha subunit